MLGGAAYIPSPNCDDRPAGCAVELVVVHAISLPPDEFGGDGVERLFTNRLDPQQHPYYAQIHQLRVSAHFFVRRDGRVVQFVPCTKRAWHAGASSWQGRARCNDFSIGIELEGCDTRPFAAIQYARLAHLIGAVARRHGPCAVVGHADVAPGRKTDPGPCFDWPRLHALLAKKSLR
ncbi:MAG: 1,6-anhydro-N-acetylmuramyl-L-alanine amidase AmpD [Rhodocyclales bacterium]|nr:1,6-anhydro-N-acetylmuramyl-L-alanine amidase AmpD [Rhodocyclales bacterium]